VKSSRAVITMRVLCVSAPSAPTKVLVASNVTDSVVVRWMSPLAVVHRVDRYFVKYHALGEPHGDNIIMEDVNNSYDFHEVNLLSFLLIFASEGWLVDWEFIAVRQ